MIKKLVFLLLGIFFTASVTMAGDEVKLPETLKAGKTDLILNGTGIRDKKIAFINLDLYKAGLYLVKKSHDADKIMNADEPMAIRLHIVSRLITPERMSESVNEGFVKSTNGNTDSLRERIDKMITVFKDGIDVDDVYDLIYIPGEGVHITKNNGNALVIKGLDFKKGLFGIWICSNPVQEPLRNGMLGL